MTNINETLDSQLSTQPPTQPVCVSSLNSSNQPVHTIHIKKNSGEHERCRTSTFNLHSCRVLLMASTVWHSAPIIIDCLLFALAVQDKRSNGAFGNEEGEDLPPRNHCNISFVHPLFLGL